MDPSESRRMDLIMAKRAGEFNCDSLNPWRKRRVVCLPQVDENYQNFRFSKFNSNQIRRSTIGRRRSGILKVQFENRVQSSMELVEKVFKQVSNFRSAKFRAPTRTWKSMNSSEFLSDKWIIVTELLSQEKLSCTIEKVFEQFSEKLNELQFVN